MTTAMPAVKPVVTGKGTNSISFPIPVAPSTMRITPAMAVARSRPPRPKRAEIGTRIGHEGGGRPRDLDARAAEERDDRAADDRGVEPVLRRHAGGDGQRHRQRKGHDADHDAGHGVVPQRGPAVAGPQAVAQGGAQAAEGRDGRRRERLSAGSPDRGRPRGRVPGHGAEEGTTRHAARASGGHSGVSSAQTGRWSLTLSALGAEPTLAQPAGRSPRVSRWSQEKPRDRAAHVAREPEEAGGGEDPSR